MKYFSDLWWNELLNAAIITVDIPWQWFVELLPSVIVQAVLFMGNGDLWDRNYDNSDIFIDENIVWKCSDGQNISALWECKIVEPFILEYWLGFTIHWGKQMW